MTRRPWLLWPAVLALGGCEPTLTVGTNEGAAQAGADAAARFACGDGGDNDRDGEVDFPFDPGCTDPSDDDERDPSPPPACSDDLDNDGDQIADFPLDPGCASAADDDELDPPTPPECADGDDNDGDGKTDYPEDEGCLSAGDDEEALVTS